MRRASVGLQPFERVPCLSSVSCCGRVAGAELERKQREKGAREERKPHEIIIKRSKRGINAFQWHIMIDSVGRRSLFPAGLWPLDRPYIIHIKLDSGASQRQRT